MVIPDFEGGISAYFAGNYKEYSGLDSLRAARIFLNGSNNTLFVLFGYSGGVQAVAWMANLHEKYAPDANIVGAASGGTIVDTWNPYELVDTPLNPLKGSTTSIIADLLLACPHQNETIWPHIYSHAKDAINTLRYRSNRCLSTVAPIFYGKSIRGSIDMELLSFNVFSYTFVHESMLTNFSAVPVCVPMFPRYMFHGDLYELASLPLFQQYIDQQNTAGSNITL